MKQKILNNFTFIAIIVLLLIHFSSVLNSFFSQDDFFHLRVVMNKTYQDIPSFFFSLQKEYAFFRPLSRETFNLIMYRSFGLNPLPFHLVNYFLISCNIILIFILARAVSKNKFITYVSTVIYAASSIHSVELYYLASVQTLLATFFLLLSVAVYVIFLVERKVTKYLLSIFFFILSLLSHEMSIVLPGIIFLAELFCINGKFSTRNFKFIIMRLLPFALIAFFYLFTTSLFIHLPSEQVYQPILSPKSILNSLIWYTIWSFGLSEILIDFIGPSLKINPNLLKWYGTYLGIVMPLLGLVLFTIIGLIIKFKRKFIKNRIFLFFISSYLMALSPFLFFPQHKSTFYLSFSMVWFSMVLAFSLSSLWDLKKIGKITTVLIIVSLIVISYQTTELNKLTYWAAKRGSAAKYLLSEIKKKYPSLPQGAVFYIRNDPNYPKIAREWGNSSKQAFYILSGGDALKLLYKDNLLRVYFEDVSAIPDDIDKMKVIFHVAQFPY
ncbi:hypothetical protein A2617_03990 [Candidatus Daviesbacteria bacterium RIFOXYD1_FULL_41_10]|uniref:Glycosyltransferase RgtA/B/C/D-like domain-containing protein n=1 Tax=Candidatus Daviesbacteria bacterium RIFOXYD1_FULL_41_10 TaxID=1797801 RepID=A0A1F5N0C6_9BACT|nr:MAG: hypothetical protein A2617_03990 [Candidatus Daviesbacteria bacterium RIFOXYD1_FULL_41_10]